MEFEWDEAKNQTNIEKHGIPFTVAAYILAGKYLLKSSDRDGETRWIAVGEYEHRLFAVVFTRRQKRYRIISIRRARHAEERDYRSLYQ